ncbi:TPA: hypothetical protein ACWCDB_005185, partial [Escherichia coli]
YLENVAILASFFIVLFNLKYGAVWIIPLCRCTELYDFGHQNRCCPAIQAIPESHLAKKQS